MIWGDKIPIVDDKLKLVQNAATFEGLFNAVSTHPNTGIKFFKDDLTWDVVPKQFQSVITVAKTGNGDFVCSDAAYASDLACFQAAIDYVPDGGTLAIMSGTYAINDNVLRTTKSVTIVGIGSVIFNLSGGGGNVPVIHFTGSNVLSTTLSSNSDEGSRVVNLTSVTGVQPGDLIKIYNTDVWVHYGDDDQLTGEMYQIYTVVDNVITLTQPLIRNYLSSNTTIKIYHPISVHLENISFIGTGPTDDVAGVQYTWCVDSTVKNCTFDNNGRRTLILYGCYNATIDNCNIANSREPGTGYGVTINDASAGVTVSRCRIQNCRHCIESGTSDFKGLNRDIRILCNLLIGADTDDEANVIDAHPMTINYLIDGNDIYPGKQTDAPFWAYHAVSEGVQKCIFSNNQVHGGGAVKRRVSVPSCNDIITNNNVSDTFGRNLYTYANNKAGRPVSLVISGNLVKNCTIPGNAYGTGIELNSEDYRSVVISNNIIDTCSVSGISVVQPSTSTEKMMLNISNNVIRNVQKHGISLRRIAGTTVLSATITGNTITDVNQESWTGMGIYLLDVEWANITGNTIENRVGTALRGICERTVLGATSFHNAIQTNTIHGASVSIELNGTDSVAQNNPGFNPVGNFTAPSVPASMVAYTNNYGYPCQVQVSGGTVTKITLDGVATGMTTFFGIIPPGGTIAITYSSAPTWKWWGL